jgi:hypothetical protein
MTLGLTFVSRLQQSSVSLSDGLYDRVLGAQTAEPSPLDPPICLDLRAASGAAATATIVVENTRAAAAEVACRVSYFMPRSGGQRFEPAMTIEPDRFRLLPGEARDVDITLTLDPVRFAVGTDYVATLLVSGAGERDLVIQLIARADVPMPTRQSAKRAAPAVDKPDPVGVRPGATRRGVRKR